MRLNSIANHRKMIYLASDRQNSKRQRDMAFILQGDTFCQARYLLAIRNPALRAEDELKGVIRCQTLRKGRKSVNCVLESLR